jgi:hypothetical protein
MKRYELRLNGRTYSVRGTLSEARDDRDNLRRWLWTAKLEIFQRS